MFLIQKNTPTGKVKQALQSELQLSLIEKNKDTFSIE